MKLTGERPIEGKTPDSLLALHSAGYREVRAKLSEGKLLDLGCGLGDYSALFASDKRSVTGVDYDPATAKQAYELHSKEGLSTLCSDGSALGLVADSYDFVCSSHLIEHFVEPQYHVQEVARVLKGSGKAFFLTPNEPADFENPYHVYLFTQQKLKDMLEKYFHEVEIIGLDANEHVKADFEKRRNMARRLLKLDPFGIRHKLPRSWFVALHAAGRRVAYSFLSSKQSAGNSGITDNEFFTTESIDDSILVLIAVASKPKI